MDKKLNYDAPMLEIKDIEIDDILIISGVSKNAGTFDWELGEPDEIW